MAEQSPCDELRALFVRLRGVVRFLENPLLRLADCVCLDMKEPADTKSLVVVNGHLCAAVVRSVVASAGNITSAVAVSDAREAKILVDKIKTALMFLMDEVKTNIRIDASAAVREEFAVGLFTPASRDTLVAECQASLCSLNDILTKLGVASIACNFTADTEKAKDEAHFQSILAGSPGKGPKPKR